jgi:putative flippase GtrA
MFAEWTDPRWLRRLRAVGWVARFTSHIPPGQFARYLAVGLWNTVFGYSTFAALTALLDPVVPHSYIPACVLSNLLNITVAFLGYKRFVFRTQGHYLREWFRCVVVYGSGMVMGLAVLPVLVFALRHGAGLGRSAPYVAGALLTILGVAYSFLGHRNYSFRSAPIEPPSASGEAAG